MKKRIINIFIILVFLVIAFISGFLIQKSNISIKIDNENDYLSVITDLKKENEILKNRLLDVETDVDILTNENNELRFELSNNEIESENYKTIEVSIVEKDFIIEGSSRKMAKNQMSLLYNDDIYVPVSFLVSELGRTVQENDNWINIGDNVLNEGFLPNKEIIINEYSDPDTYEELFGKPNAVKTYINECTGNQESKYEYDGVILITGRSIEITKPVLTTLRGITIGSTKEDVEKAYGTRALYDSTEDHWIYGSYKNGLYFEFENGKVIKFGNFILDC